MGIEVVVGQGDEQWYTAGILVPQILLPKSVFPGHLAAVTSVYDYRIFEEPIRFELQQ